ncbi:MAG: hypothetical protein KF868_10685 [Acidobacteria bacterium]|nr:hypothetical protein [Acidobacteriota bacterium]MCW5970223.1 hypothetical protein [Blastocatellales bacterium]
MQTSRTRLEDMDFKPRTPFLRLALILLVFSFFTFVLITETKSRLEFSPITDPNFLAETVFVVLLLLLFSGFMLSYLLLQFRLRFTEEGIHRRTLLKPRLIRWDDVKRAQVSGVRGYFALELWVSRRRCVLVPLLEYGRGRSLLAEIRKRLAVEVEVSERNLAVLREE